MRINPIKKRRHVTLVEMLLVLVVLSIITGIIGINVVKSIREQRFRSEVQLVVDQMRLAQQLMLITNIDVHLKFTKDPDYGIKYWLETSKELPEYWQKEIARPHKPLTTIQFVEFEDLLGLPYEDGVIDLKFLSNGVVMSHGIMRLATNEFKSDLGALERFICLNGYPSPIMVKNSEEYCSIVDVAKDNELTRYLVEEIQSEVVK